MKTAKTALAALASLVALGSLATSSIACSASSSSSKDDVDTGSALAQLRSPTGSFSEQTAGSAFGNYRSTRADSSKIATPSASSSGDSSMQSIRFLDTAASQTSTCQQGAACACPGGGSMTYTGSNTVDGQLVKVTFDACVFEDGFSFDGKAALLLSPKSLLGLAAPSSASADTGAGAGGTAAGTSGTSSAASILLAAKGTAADGTRKLSLEFALVTEAHYAFLAVEVADGSIVIGVSDAGDAIVRSREGTWTCHEDATSGWSCTSDSGKSLNVTEQAPSDPSASPAPSGSGSAAPAPSGSGAGSGSGSPAPAPVP